MANLTTLALVKSLDAIVSATHDATLTALIAGVSESFDRYCGRPLAQVTIAAERAVGAGYDVLLLNFELAANPSLVLDAAGATVGSSLYAADVDRYQHSRLLRRTDGSVWPSGAAFTVTYLSGFSPAPGDLAMACAEEVLLTFKQFRAEGGARLGLEQQVLDAGGTASHRERALSARTLGILDAYRRKG